MAALCRSIRLIITWDGKWLAPCRGSKTGAAVLEMTDPPCNKVQGKFIEKIFHANAREELGGHAGQTSQPKMTQ